MIEDVKLYAKISAKAFLKWFFVVFTGSLLTAVFFLIVLFQSMGVTSGGAHTGAFLPMLLVPLAAKNPCGLLLVAGAPIFAVLYFVLANKMAIQTVLYGLWTNKAIRYVEPALNRIITKFTNNNDWAKEASDSTMLRARLLDESRRDASVTGLNKRVINYALRKMRLDDIDFQDKNLKLADVISVKFTEFISETLKPGFMLFWILAGVQILLFIFAQIYKFGIKINL